MKCNVPIKNNFGESLQDLAISLCYCHATTSSAGHTARNEYARSQVEI
jgi:hypothetical protein